jgi:hypothetical protein
MAEVSDGSTGFSQPGVDLPGDAEPVMQPPIPHLLPCYGTHLIMLLLDRLPIHHPLLGLVCTALNRKSVMPRTAGTSSNVRPSHSQNSMLDTPHARRK